MRIDVTWRMRKEGGTEGRKEERTELRIKKGIKELGRREGRN
jgi:hypothetical protein